MKKTILLTLTFLIYYLLFFIPNTYSQITRGAAEDEIYLSNGWFADLTAPRYGIFHSTDNGAHITPVYSNLETPPPNEMAVGRVLGDANPGALYNYGNNELWVSFDGGVSWEYKETYGSSGRFASGCTNGEIYKCCVNPQGTIWRSNDYGNGFVEIRDNAKYILETGNNPGNLYGLDGGAGEGYLIHYSIDYGENFIEIPIDSTVAFSAPSGLWPQISRGTEPGELYLVSWWPDYHYKIFHSVDTGYTWTQQYESGYIDTFYWGVAYTAGREPGSFYVKRSRINPAGTHAWLYIDYSSDYGQTFTSYFHDLVPDFTSVNYIEKPDINLTNYPNPFSNQTTIYFQLPANTKNPLLKIYNLHGKLIRQYNISNKIEQLWDGTDNNGKRIPKGIYLYNITYNNTSTSLHKILLIN